MTVTYRDATPADLPAVDALFRASFTATFGHLYQQADFDAFMGKFTPRAWAAELAQPDLVDPAGRARRGAARLLQDQRR